MTLYKEARHDIIRHAPLTIEARQYIVIEARTPIYWRATIELLVRAPINYIGAPRQSLLARLDIISGARV